MTVTRVKPIQDFQSQGDNHDIKTAIRIGLGKHEKRQYDNG